MKMDADLFDFLMKLAITAVTTAFDLLFNGAAT
ncbi:hypothetical protein ABAC460_12190 [Asticcacaulis sp. AC460]|nr:hypothetical protein ABAC460_12190 [Asticcacaulis sp. AC460]